jgi:hypothetical protein
LRLIIVAVTAPIIIARAWTIIVAPSPVVIGWPSAIDKNWIVPVIVARWSAVKGDIQRRAWNGWRANDHFSSHGIDAPGQYEEICDAESREQDCEQSASQQRQGVHKTYITPSGEACQIRFAAGKRAPIFVFDDLQSNRQWLAEEISLSSNDHYHGHFCRH